MTQTKSGTGLFTPRQVLAVIIANMIGTGVFTSLGYQLVDIKSGFVILLLWAAGGAAALSGALSYAELGGALSRSGGEYNFLGRIYHPGLGFVAGFVSATVGFAAPVALAAMAFAAYATSSLNATEGIWIERLIACGLILGLAGVHSRSRRASGQFQSLFTAIKILVILVFCGAVFFILGEKQSVRFVPQAGDMSAILSAPFAVSLIYVGYAYTGWNAATYIIGEMDMPQRNLPRVLALGTAIVLVLYLALNAAFLLAAPMQIMVGEEEVGFIAAQYAFGDFAGRFAGLILAGLLISTISAMTITGPRVLQVIGQDLRPFAMLSQVNNAGVPGRAIWFQTLIAIAFVLFSSFETLLVFSGFVLTLMSFLTVLGVIVLRLSQPHLERPFRVPLFPIVPLIYLFVSGWALYFIATTRLFEVAYSAVLIGGAIIVYVLAQWRDRQTGTHEDETHRSDWRG